jgi:hypothetical protein
LAVSNAAVFETRPATGNDLNSGGFVTTAGGTDYSQQTSPHVTFDGVTIAAHTAGTTATIIITGYTVATTDVGNLVRIAGGTNFTAGLYQILSVSTGANTWTLDRNSCSGAGIGMTGRMGGALATLVQFFADVDANTGALGGYVCYITGTYTITTAILINGNYNTNASSGNTNTTLGGVQVIGYSATRGDNGQFTLTTATNSTDLLHYSNTNRNVTFYNCAFTTTAATTAIGCTTPNNSAQPCKLGFDNCSWAGFTFAIWTDQSSNGAAFNSLYMRNCVVSGCTSGGVYISAMTLVQDCYFHGNTNDGLHCSANGNSNRGPIVCIGSIFYNNTGIGVNNQALSNAPTVSDNVTIMVNCCCVSNTSDGFRANVTGGNGLINVILQNSIFYGNGGFGVNLPTIYGLLLGGYNAYGSNTSGAYGNAMVAQPGDVTLSGDPFTGRTSNDFSLNSTAGAGAACKQVGFPGVLQAGGTGHADIGPLSPSAGGGGGTVIVPSKPYYTFLGDEA